MTSIFKTKFKAINRYFLVLMIFGLVGIQIQAQVVRLIDNKGTISSIRNNQVTSAATAPLLPLENDIWIDTTTNTVKVWEGTPLNDWQEMASIRNWISNTNSGTYAIDHLVSYNGAIYKNLTGTNLDTSPNVDTTNWASTASLFQSDGVNSIDLAVQSDGSARITGTEVVITDNGRLGVGTTSPSHKADFHGSTGGANIVVVGVGDVEGSTNPLFYLQAGAGEAVIQSRRNHPLVLKVNNIQRLKLNTDDSAEFRGNIHTKDFSTEWLSDADGGSYAIDYIVIHNGVFYKNLTGTNLNTTPDLDTTNWIEVVPSFEVVPLWKSDTDGGSYATNDIINYNGILYKNLTAVNLDTTPDLDTSNWFAIINALTTFSQDDTSLTGEITYNDENGDEFKAQVVSSDINNSLSVGADGGAFYASPVRAYGKVNSTGAPLRIFGATVIRNSTGRYTVTLNIARPTENYIINLTVLESVNRRDDIDIHVTTQTTTTFTIAIHEGDNATAAGTNRDRDWYFSVMDF